MSKSTREPQPSELEKLSPSGDDEPWCASFVSYMIKPKIDAAKLTPEEFKMLLEQRGVTFNATQRVTSLGTACGNCKTPWPHHQEWCHLGVDLPRDELAIAVAEAHEKENTVWAKVRRFISGG